MKLAKIRHRIMASLLDLGVVLGFLVLIVLMKLPFTISMLVTNESVATPKFVFDVFRWGIIVAILLLIYYIIVPLLLKGQTLGKKVFKLKIVKENNDKIDPSTMFYREGIGGIFINIASLGITAIVSIIVMCLRDDNKGLADILAKTKVVDLYESEE